MDYVEASHLLTEKRIQACFDVVKGVWRSFFILNVYVYDCV